MNDTIRKLVIPVAAIAALGYGGAQLAGASSSHSSGAKTDPAVSAPAGDGDGETADDTRGEGNDPADPAEQVTGSEAEQAKAAALKAVPGGTVGEIHQESKDDAGQPADKPEAGDTPDPSYERNIAYDVDVQKGDGSTVTVHLDEAFSVLGVEADQPDQGEGHGSDD